MTRSTTLPGTRAARDAPGARAERRPTAPGIAGRLHVAHMQAMAGADAAARRLCAALIAEEAMVLCRDREAVAALLAVLLLAGGFEQAARLVRTLTGTTLRLLPDAPAPPGTTSEPRLREADGTLSVLLDASQLAGRDRAAVARRWSEAILRALPG